MIDEGSQAGAVLERIAQAPVKGTTLLWPRACRLDEHGVPGDRLFHVLDAGDGRQLNANPGLLPIRTGYDAATNVLTMQLPGAGPVSAVAQLGEPVVGTVAWDGGRKVRSRSVRGPWSALLSAHLDRDVVLARPLTPRRAVDDGPVTLVALASVHELQRHLDGVELDPARFRMNLYLDGLTGYEEDRWYGRRVAIGEAILRIRGPVARCAIVTYDPRSGAPDAPVLKAIVASREPIEDPVSGQLVRAPFGVSADVERPGRVAVGDRARVLG
jgi:uncharacterized protein YcbX